MATAEESKFVHLLQPIKDLATNWNINIAEDLDEFLVWCCTAYTLARTRATNHRRNWSTSPLPLRMAHR